MTGNGRSRIARILAWLPERVRSATPTYVGRTLVRGVCRWTNLSIRPRSPAQSPARTRRPLRMSGTADRAGGALVLSSSGRPRAAATGRPPRSIHPPVWAD